jgi:hypothetical protein
MTLRACSKICAERVTASEGALCRPKRSRSEEGSQTRSPHGTVRLEVDADPNPIRPAERHYVQEHGSAAYDELLKRLFDELFPAE